MVAPLVGAWIEIKGGIQSYQEEDVAPLVGAWIEISFCFSHCLIVRSLLSWERGLKLFKL